MKSLLLTRRVLCSLEYFKSRGKQLPWDLARTGSKSHSGSSFAGEAGGERVRCLQTLHPHRVLCCPLGVRGRAWFNTSPWWWSLLGKGKKRCPGVPLPGERELCA